MVVFKTLQRDDEMVFKRIKAIGDAVVEMLLAQFIPEMLLRVEFRRVRGKKHQAQIVRQMKVFALVPPGAIEHHDDIVVRIATGYLVEKDLHTAGIDMGQHQTVEAAVLRTDCAIGVAIFVEVQT